MYSVYGWFQIWSTLLDNINDTKKLYALIESSMRNTRATSFFITEHRSLITTLPKANNKIYYNTKLVHNILKISYKQRVIMSAHNIVTLFKVLCTCTLSRKSGTSIELLIHTHTHAIIFVI